MEARMDAQAGQHKLNANTWWWKCNRVNHKMILRRNRSAERRKTLLGAKGATFDMTNNNQRNSNSAKCVLT